MDATMFRITAIRLTAAAGGLAIAATLVGGCSQTKETAKEAVSSASSVSSAVSAAETAASSAVGEAGAQAAAAGDVTTLYYPDESTAMFSVDAPADWVVTGGKYVWRVLFVPPGQSARVAQKSVPSSIMWLLNPFSRVRPDHF